MLVPAYDTVLKHRTGAGKIKRFWCWCRIIRRPLCWRDSAKLFRRRRVHSANVLQCPNDEFNVFVHTLSKVGSRDHGFVFAGRFQKLPVAGLERDTEYLSGIAARTGLVERRAPGGRCNVPHAITFR